ncbi:MAG: septum site-determining protein MinC [Pelistega sp.]|nr:septum site-determining protein MinC [Pelistega sp.]
MSDAHILEIKHTNGKLRLILKTTDFSGITKTIRKKMEEAKDFFAGEDIIIDAYGIVQPLPWKKLAAVLEEYQLNVLGVYANARLLPTVLADGFTHIDLSATKNTAAPAAAKPATTPTSTTQPVSSKAAEPVITAAKPVIKDAPITATTTTGSAPTMLIDRQLRSGERIYAAGGDLIIVGNVGHGAEVIADGNIHVYGHLLGRAIAGAKGDNAARIFTTHLDPQLVAIAGIYRLFDGDASPDLLKKTVMVSLKNETLSFEPIKS